MVRINQSEATGNVLYSAMFLSTHGIIGIGADGSLTNLTISKYQFAGVRANGLHTERYGESSGFMDFAIILMEALYGT